MRPVLRHSTHDVAPERRVKYWREAVHAAVVEMDLIPTQRSDFFSGIDLCPLSTLVPHRAVGSPQRITRSAPEISRGQKNRFYLISQPRLAWRCIHAGQDHLVQPGESVLIDSRVPYSFHFDLGLDDLSIEMPVEWVERWLPDPLRVIGRPLATSPGWGLALSGAKEAMAPQRLADLPVPDELIEDQLGALLSLACGSLADASLPDDGLFQRGRCAIRARLSSPGLVASEVAAACGVSLRTLHRSMAAQGVTFAGLLMSQRIDEAARLLSDRRFRGVSIAEIGHRCGFLDASHFARQFRRWRQVGPRQFRLRLNGSVAG